MPTRSASLFLVAITVVLSWVSIVGGEMLVPLMRAVRPGPPVSWEQTRRDLPTVTLWACDHLWLVPVLLAAVCFGSLVAVRRVPQRMVSWLVAGCCRQGLVVWAAMFCFFYAGFLGGMCMHHGPEFELGQFFSLAGGLFPVTLVCLLVPLTTSLWLQRHSPPDPHV